MNNKHTAVYVILGLILVFGAIVTWYTLGHKTLTSGGQTATTTPSTPVTTFSGHIDDVGKYYDAHATYPTETPLPGTASSDAITAMMNFGQQTIDSFKESGNFAKLTAEDVKIQNLDSHHYALDVTFKKYSGSQTVTYVFTIYEDTLGAHPNTYFRTFTFDTHTGQALELSDLFQPTASYLERISKEVRSDLPVILNIKSGMPADAKMIESGTFPDVDSFQNFAIDGDTLSIIFPPYQVAPYSYGTVTDPLKLSKLSDILKPIYIP